MSSRVVSTWRSLHRWPRRWRWLTKCVFLLTVVALTLYPKPWLLPRWLTRLRDIDRVLDPDRPELAELERHLRALPDEAALPQVAAAVEEVVTRHVPYAFDWDTWGVVDYLPTVTEVFARGREDCDGRAVVAASLLRRLGYEAQLVCDLKHTWVVATDPRTVPPRTVELMGPTGGEKTFTGTAGGTRTRLSLQTLANLGRGLAFGIAVFPLLRELVIVGAVWLTLMHPGCSQRRAFLAAVLLVAALLLCRAAGPSTTAAAQQPALLWTGLVVATIGCVLLVGTTRPRRRSLASAQNVQR